MLSHHYHYWVRILLQHLEVTDLPFGWDITKKYEGGTVVVVKNRQAVTVQEKGKHPPRTFKAETTMRLDDPTTLVIDGFEGNDFASMNVEWEKISLISCSYNSPSPRRKSDWARVDSPLLTTRARLTVVPGGSGTQSSGAQHDQGDPEGVRKRER